MSGAGGTNGGMPARVEKPGGTVAIGRRAVGAMGFSAYVFDAENNLTGLWQNA